MNVVNSKDTSSKTHAIFNFEILNVIKHISYKCSLKILQNVM